ncbi:unnamed protein product [Lepeophtheirus salmonis]|uniref:(salmon louse) hypothetical protein n=1 Tax=Lepeophtheirus salmonis TaxID=72036 RepID=A0A7R8CV61_LEPSM|nr:unnamed protein product [Lepeophtheirus salmonis]CAF2940716.1 unnamed protein product [Lepeophtheirus salmonis]
MDIYYCGFNSFHHVPSCPESPTLARLTLQSEALPEIRDVAICWNFMALVDNQGSLLQYGLGFQSLDRRMRELRLPSEARGEVLRLSATPRHLLAVTGTGETWSYEEGKGWRRLAVLNDTAPAENEETPVDGVVYSWGGRVPEAKLGHGSLHAETQPRPVSLLEGIPVVSIAAGGWHSAVVTKHGDLYTFGWNESGQLAQATNLAKPPECFSAVEKLFMACCTMQPEDATIPRVEDKLSEEDSLTTCYSAASCNQETDIIVVQPTPVLVTFPRKDNEEIRVLAVSCGSRHTVVLTEGNALWAFGWNKYGQLGLGHTRSKDTVERVPLPKEWAPEKNNSFDRVRRLGNSSHYFVSQ